VRVVTFKIDEELLYKLDVYAVKLGMSRSELIRHLIKEYIREKSKSNFNYKTVKL